MAKTHSDDLKTLQERLRETRRALVKQLIAGTSMSHHDLDRFTKAQARLEVVKSAIEDEGKAA
jgi:hypothetical protein